MGIRINRISTIEVDSVYKDYSSTINPRHGVFLSGACEQTLEEEPSEQEARHEGQSRPHEFFRHVVL